MDFTDSFFITLCIKYNSIEISGKLNWSCFAKNFPVKQCFKFSVCRMFWSLCRKLVRQCESWTPLFLAGRDYTQAAAIAPWCVTVSPFVSFASLSVKGNIHSGVSGNSSIVATGVYSARELLHVTRGKSSFIFFLLRSPPPSPPPPSLLLLSLKW